MTSTERPARPRFTGVDTYKDPLGRFTFRFPSDWHQFELDNGMEGVLFSPESENPQTFFSAWVRQLDAEAIAEDVPILQKGIAAGLEHLTDCVIESSSDDAYGNLLKFERVYTFRDGDATRKRKVWIMYVAQWQIVLTYQGRSPEAWEYWLPMGNYAFALFNIPPELWFATDRDLNQKPGLPKKEKTKRGRVAEER
ncbi:MAG: hypothetical protein HXY39_07350 [Chloroflexi bacterium]|nr:hypothetical protein [Chloroflexota bacterium]